MSCEALKSWSSWLQEGYYLSYVKEGVRYYEHVIGRDLAHWEYQWDETIPAGDESGPTVPDDLEITKGYDKKSNTNHIWQWIFGIKGEVYIYIELPTDVHRHGIAKVPKPSRTFRKVSHFEEWMSPFNEPSFITEHFLMRPDIPRVALSAYNPNAIDLPDVWLNFFMAKLVTERIGVQYIDEEAKLVLKPTNEKRWAETLDKLYRRIIPHRPLTLLPVHEPAVAPTGE